MYNYKKLTYSMIIALIVLMLVVVGMMANFKGEVLNRNNINQNKKNENNANENNANREKVLNIVNNFGSKLQLVSLLAPEDTLKKSMQENYGSLVSDALIEKWIKDPLNAPGRLTSSPWPDRIEILSISKLSGDTYEVKGEIIEITSQEKGTQKAAARRPITLIVKNKNGWRIENVTLSSYE